MSIFISDCKELDLVRSSKEIFYMKVLKHSLDILGAWPETETGEPLTKHKLNLVRARVMVFTCCFPTMVAYIAINQDKIDFFQIGHNYITLFMCVVAASRQCLPLFKNYQQVSADFITNLHLFYHKSRCEYAMKIHVIVHKLSHFYTMYAISMCICGILLYNLTPFVNNIVSGQFSAEEPVFELSVYYSVPKIDFERSLYGYIFVFWFNWFISVICSAAFVCIDLHLSLMIFHLWGHLKILKNELETFPIPSNDKTMFTEQEDEQIFIILKKAVDYHRFIMTFADRMSETFGLMLLIFYAFHQISGCLLLLECSQLEARALLRYGPLTVVMFQQLIQLSCLIELIATQSEKLIDAVYGIPWEYMNTRNRMIAGFFLKKVQNPIRMKAMGIANVGVTTMAAILKTSLSYFAFLRSKEN